MARLVGDLGQRQLQVRHRVERHHPYPRRRAGHLQPDFHRPGALDPHPGQGRPPGVARLQFARAGRRSTPSPSPSSSTSTAPPSTCPGSGASLMAAFAPSYRAQLVRFQVDEDALAANSRRRFARPRLPRRLRCSPTRPYVPGLRLGDRGAVQGDGCLLAPPAATRSQLRRLGQGALDSTLRPLRAGAHRVHAGLGVHRPPGHRPRRPRGRTGLEPIAFSPTGLLLLVTERQTESLPELVTSLVGSEQARLNELFPRAHQVGQGPGRPAVRHMGHDQAALPRSTPTPGPRRR